MIKGGFMYIALLAFYGVLMASTALAEVVQVDSSAWTRDQKNGTHTAVSRILYEAGITHKGIKIVSSNVEVIEPSLPVDEVLKKSAIEAEYQQWVDEVNAANLIEQKKINAMQKEMAVNTMNNVTLADIDTRIDAISDLTQNKEFVRELTHYLWAKGYFEND